MRTTSPAWISHIDEVVRERPPPRPADPGRITIEFDQPRQAIEKLLALAIGNDSAASTV